MTVSCVLLMTNWKAFGRICFFSTGHVSLYFLPFSIANVKINVYFYVISLLVAM